MLYLFFLSSLGTELHSPPPTIDRGILTSARRPSFPKTQQEDSDMQLLLCRLFLSMYLVTITGNLLIILTISSDSHLHTPMYFFLSNLSFADICFTSTTVPKMLVTIQTQSKMITFAGCLTQIFFFTAFGCLDNLLLTLMAYDRFVAICHPCTT
ncbi:hypothetical protein H8958_013130 [Nasalis larvatus]